MKETHEIAHVSRAHEDYLEAIYMLSASAPANASDVAAFLGVSRPAVSKSLKELQALGYLEPGKYQVPHLTPEGSKIARAVYGRHTLLKAFLISLGVSETAAETDCCKIEHVISQETLNAIKKAMK